PLVGDADPANGVLAQLLVRPRVRRVLGRSAEQLIVSTRPTESSFQPAPGSRREPSGSSASACAFPCRAPTAAAHANTAGGGGRIARVVRGNAADGLGARRCVAARHTGGG